MKLIMLCVYLMLMIIVGALYYKKTQSFDDYILGGRKLGPFTTAFSAQSSDMSGWLLLGLPGAAFLTGVEASWIAIGLAAGTYLNWKMVAKRLRKYTEVANNSLTLADFFEHRFKDNTRILRVVSSVVIIVFFSVYTSAQFSTGGKLFELLIGIPYQTSLIIGAIVIIAYTFLGGFMAVSVTDFIQGLLMFFALILVPVVAIAEIGGVNILMAQLQGIEVNYMNMFASTGAEGIVGVISIISSLAWGLGYFGQPHILVRFMAIESPDKIKKARRVAMIWVLITLTSAVIIGMVGRVYILGTEIADPEKIFMLLVDSLFPGAIAGILFAAILAASMSTADSQLLVAASSVSQDIYKQFINKKASDEKMMSIGRYSVTIIAIAAALIAFDPNSSVFGLVANAWAGLGAAFGPVVVLSLFWKRMNKWGAIAGMISGSITVFGWIALKKVATSPLFGLYELVPGFIVACIFIVIVSLVTPAPSDEIVKEFERV